MIGMGVEEQEAYIVIVGRVGWLREGELWVEIGHL